MKTFYCPVSNHMIILASALVLLKLSRNKTLTKVFPLFYWLGFEREDINLTEVEYELLTQFHTASIVSLILEITT